MAIGDFLQRQLREQMLSQLNQVYTTGPDNQEKALLRQIKKKAGGTVKERW